MENSAVGDLVAVYYLVIIIVVNCNAILSSKRQMKKG
jgi:hypothetical protein